MKRRTFLKATAAVGAASTFGAFSARAQSAKVVRIGWQKAGYLPSIKQQGVIEKILNPRGIEVKWVEFQFGPPMLEALNTGNVDYGYAGDSPPIFAQAAASNVYYVAALPLSGRGQAVIVPADSPIKSLAELKGKKVGLGKGSSAHNLTVAAVEHAGLSFNDIQAVYLAPADAIAAFTRGALDAWTIWDPFFARAELNLKARVLAYDADIKSSHAFYLANRAFTDGNPEITALINTEFKKAGQWAEANKSEVAKTLHEATGVELEAVTRAIDRLGFEVIPLNNDIIASQQRIADRFHGLKLIPKKIDVREVVWTWKPQS